MENNQILELAIELHNKYEIYSQEEKWKTQDLTRGKPFAQLPLTNQKVMIRMAELVLSKINEKNEFMKKEIFQILENNLELWQVEEIKKIYKEIENAS